MNINTIIWIIVAVILLLNAIREYFVYRDIKYMFICEHCGTLNKELYNKSKCSKCHRSMKLKGKTWDHMLIHRVNWISANDKTTVLKLKDYKKLPIIEITLTLIALVIVIIAIILSV